MSAGAGERGPSERELRWAGVFVLGAFVVIGGVVLWRLEALRAAEVLWTIGVVFALLYYGVRPLRRPLYDLWMGITSPLGWAISHLALALIYFGIITPIGWLMRLFGWDSLHRRFDRDVQSYWVDHDSGEVARYFRQY